MTDSELDKKLAAARVPQLDADYANDFARSVQQQLRVAYTPSRSRSPLFPRFAWSIGFALFFLVAGFMLGHRHGKPESSAPNLLANTKLISQTLSLFPNRVRAIIQNQQGVQLVLADQPNVPDSMPLFVKICDGTNCSSLVTFSGQELNIAGQKITVLADVHGGIILEGNEFVWSTAEPTPLPSGLKIEAEALASQRL